MNYLFALAVHAISIMDRYAEWAAQGPESPGIFSLEISRRSRQVGPFLLALFANFAFFAAGSDDFHAIPVWLSVIGEWLTVAAMMPAFYVGLRSIHFEITAEVKKGGK